MFLFEQLFSLRVVLALVELDRDDCEGEVDEEERTDEDDEEEVETEDVVERLLDVPHDRSPPLESRHDVHHEERREDVVEVGDTEVRVLVVLRAEERTVWSRRTRVTRAQHRGHSVGCDVQLAGLCIGARVLEETRKELQTCDREDEEDEDQHHHDLEEVGDGVEDREDEGAELADRSDCLERSENSERAETREVDGGVGLHEEREVPRHHDREVEEVPGIAHVGAAVEDEAETEDLEDHLEGVDVEKDLLRRLEVRRLHVLRGVLESESDGVDDDEEDGESLEDGVGDDLAREEVDPAA